MAARRAAAKAAAAAVAEPPPSAPEPVPEPEPEPKEPDVTEKNVVPEDNAMLKSKESLGKEGKVTERVIERIIICPGGQNPYMNPPPPLPPQPHYTCPCPPEKKKKKGKKREGGEEFCQHPFCVAQRARNIPQGLPWASGLFPGSPQPPAKPQVVICQRPVICCCSHCKESSEEEEDSEEEDQSKTDTETYMTFMNMVFAAANVMNERRDVF